MNSGLPSFIGNDDDAPLVTQGAMTVRNGLYSIQIEMTEGGRGHATGIIVLRDGTIAGGDSYFYYTGTYTADRGKWRGELTTYQHTKSAGALLLFGGREVTCGFTGTYSAEDADVTGTALVGKTSVLFEAKLKLRSTL
jgi:T3SS negative regulator,GrlR